MRPSGFIIRFIDIGLLLLFAFLFLSDLTVDTQIKLPGSNSDAPVQDREQTTVTLTVVTDEAFRLSSSDETFSDTMVNSLTELRRALGEIRSYYSDRQSDVVVIISPSGDSMIQTTVYVLDICDDLGLQKSLDTQSIDY